MSDGYKLKEVILNGAASVAVAQETTTPVSNPFVMSSKDSLNFTARVTTSTATTAAAQTAKLQESADGVTWEDVGNRAQVSITTDASAHVWEIAIVATDSSDAAQLPILPLCRVVVTAGTGDSCTVTSVKISRRM